MVETQLVRDPAFAPGICTKARKEVSVSHAHDAGACRQVKETANLHSSLDGCRPLRFVRDVVLVRNGADVLGLSERLGCRSLGPRASIRSARNSALPATSLSKVSHQRAAQRGARGNLGPAAGVQVPLRSLRQNRVRGQWPGAVRFYAG